MHLEHCIWIFLHWKQTFSWSEGRSDPERVGWSSLFIQKCSKLLTRWTCSQACPLLTWINSFTRRFSGNQQAPKKENQYDTSTATSCRLWPSQLFFLQELYILVALGDTVVNGADPLQRIKGYCYLLPSRSHPSKSISLATKSTLGSDS